MLSATNPERLLVFFFSRTHFRVGVLRVFLGYTEQSFLE